MWSPRVVLTDGRGLVLTERTYRAFVIAVDGETVGEINILAAAHRIGTVDYEILKHAQRKGYATRAAQVLVRWAFTKANYLTLCARTRLDNEGSQRVLLKAGFTEIRRTSMIVYFSQHQSAT